MSVFLHRNIFKEIDHYITCLSMDPLQWMGAVRMSVQTADKNITVINTTSVHQLTSCEVKSCEFVLNKYSIRIFLTSNCRFWLKYKSSIHNIAWNKLICIVDVQRMSTFSANFLFWVNYSFNFCKCSAHLCNCSSKIITHGSPSFLLPTV